MVWKRKIEIEKKSNLERTAFFGCFVCLHYSRFANEIEMFDV